MIRVARITPAARSRRTERCVLGVDVGGTNIRAGLYNPRAGSLHHLRAVRTEAAQGGAHALARVKAVAREVVDAGRASGLSVYKVGIGVPELVRLSGELDSHAVLPWRSHTLRRSLAVFGEVTVASDVRAAALAEARLGAGRGKSSFLYVGVGTGISCTLVVGGRPHAGSHGHAVAFASGATCASIVGAKLKYVSLESLASGPAVVRRAGSKGWKAADAAAVCREARVRAGIARDVVDAAAKELAVHVAILVNALDPLLVVVGGGLGGAPGRFWSSFRTALPRHTWGRHARRVRLHRSSIGATVGVIGAALSALEAGQGRALP